MKTGPAFFSSVAAAGPVTWNPGDKSSEISLSGGDLTATRATTINNNAAVRATSSKDSGKCYFEISIDTVGTSGGDYSIYGIASAGLSLNNYVGSTTGSYGYEYATGNKYNNGTGAAYGSTLTAGDVLGIAVDLDNGKIWFSKNNTWQASGDPASGTNPAYTGLAGVFFPAASIYKMSTIQHQLTSRFKSADFSFSPPSGFSAWE